MPSEAASFLCVRFSCTRAGRCARWSFSPSFNHEERRITGDSCRTQRPLRPTTVPQRRSSLPVFLCIVDISRSLQRGPFEFRCIDPYVYGRVDVRVSVLAP